MTARSHSRTRRHAARRRRKVEAALKLRAERLEALRSSGLAGKRRHQGGIR